MMLWTSDVYRRTEGSDFELIAAAHITGYAVYADFGLTSGVTYTYEVAWLDGAGGVSPLSNEASATPSARTRR